MGLFELRVSLFDGEVKAGVQKWFFLESEVPPFLRVREKAARCHGELKKGSIGALAQSDPGGGRCRNGGKEIKAASHVEFFGELRVFERDEGDVDGATTRVA